MSEIQLFNTTIDFRIRVIFSRGNYVDLKNIQYDTNTNLFQYKPVPVLTRSLNICIIRDICNLKVCLLLLNFSNHLQWARINTLQDMEIFLTFYFYNLTFIYNTTFSKYSLVVKVLIHLPVCGFSLHMTFITIWLDSTPDIVLLPVMI